MSNYKLVPVEPTTEMESEGMLSLCGSIGGYESGLVQKCWHAMLAAAPAVQGEPFAWATFDGEGSYDLMLYEENEDYRDEWLSLNPKYRDWVRPLYEAPQPAEQKPSPDVAGLVEALEQCVTSMLASGYRADAVVIQAARAALAAYRKGAEG